MTDFICFAHPNPLRDCPTPKEKWKRASSNARYAKRYGHPRRLYSGELGTFQGIRIIKDGNDKR